MELELAGKKVLVIGAGISGFAAAKVAKRFEAEVTLSDAKAEKDLKFDFTELREAGIELTFGPQQQSLLEGKDMVIVSPAVPVRVPIIKAAYDKGIRVLSEVEMAYDGDDEIGLLSRTFNQLIRHLKVYINDLNNLAYADALTSVHNKGAYDIYMRDLQNKLDAADGKLEFAVVTFDCDDLKQINDLFGHEKGDIYLKTACSLICSVFAHSPVFRIGGDEFSVILQGDDFRRREELLRLFDETGTEICAFTDIQWEQVRVSMGMAEYDPGDDRSALDVARRADKLMYENKRIMKSAQGA